MKRELVLSQRFKNGFANVVIVDGLVIAICHSYADALEVAKYYRGLSSKPYVDVVMAVVNMGQVFMA